jgi:glycerophosphoryl diester phosphodiesterase
VSERPFSQDATSTLVVAHRGASKARAENTQVAFEAAIVAGADAVEFDVRLTADGVPVVIHDATLDRTTDGVGPVSAVTLAELRNVTIPTPEGPLEVPTFREVLDELSGRAAIDVELKNVPGDPDFEPGGERLVAATIETLADAAFDGDVLVSSFDPVALAAVRRRAPGVATGLLTSGDVDALAAVTFARDQGHGWVLPFVGAVRAAGPALIEAASGASVRVGTWVIDDPVEAASLASSGVGAIATNDPAVIVPAVREVTRS